MSPAYYPDSTVAIGSLHRGSARGSRVWTPTLLGANGVAWFDPTDPNVVTVNSGNIAGIASKIGPATSVTQNTAVNQPLYKIASINGLNTYNGVGGAAFLAGANVAISTQNGGVIAFIKPTAGDSGNQYLASDAALNHRFECNIGGDGKLAYNVNNGGVSGIGPSLLGASHITVVYTISGTATPDVDGTAFATSNAGNTTTTQIGIGSFAETNQFNFLGDIGDVIYFSNPTLPMVQKLEGYLAWKWGIVANLPSTHPYKTRPPLATDP